MAIHLICLIRHYIPKKGPFQSFYISGNFKRNGSFLFLDKAWGLKYKKQSRQAREKQGGISIAIQERSKRK
jgi:hypothetical protein